MSRVGTACIKIKRAAQPVLLLYGWIDGGSQPYAVLEHEKEEVRCEELGRVENQQDYDSI